MRKTPSRIFFSLFCLIAFLSLKAQNIASSYSYNVTIDLMNVNEEMDRVKVTVIPPAIQNTTIRYVLPAYIPGIPGKVDAGRFIHQFYALDDRGLQLKAKKEKDDVIVLKMKPGGTLKKIEYWIDDTWDMEKSDPKMKDSKFNYVPQCAGTGLDAGHSFVLNHAFVFGYIDGLAYIPYTVNVVKPDELDASSSLSIIHRSRTRDEYHASTYYELLDAPVMYAPADTCSFLSGKFNVSVSVYSENGKVSSRLVRRIIASQIASYTYFMDVQEPQDYKLIFYFTTPFKTVLNQYGGYGGLAHRTSAFYFMPELADEDALESEIQRVISGDILHYFAPLDFLSTCGKGDLLRPQISSSWWFNQGAEMYFNWLATVRDSFVNESEFMGYVSAMIRLSEMAPQKPLTDMPFVMQMMQDPLKREEMRARSMLVALMMDIEITKFSGGSKGLREVVIELNRTGPVPHDSLEKYIIRSTDPSMKEFFDKYVNSYHALPLIKELDMIGWAYSPSAIDSVLTFGQFGLLYDDSRDAFIVHNADTTNLFRLRDGDRIISVNTYLVSAANFDETLLPIYSPSEDDRVTVRYLRNDKNISVTATPAVKVVWLEYYIKTDPAASTDALLLHDRIFAPPLY